MEREERVERGGGEIFLFLSSSSSSCFFIFLPFCLTPLFSLFFIYFYKQQNQQQQHTDLHPGNIMVRVRDDSDNDSLQLQHQHQSLESLSSSEASASRGQLQLVLLDLGLAEELTLPVRTVFISLLNAISRGDGRAGARLMLRMSARQRCEDPSAFEKDMVRLFEASADVRSPGGIDLDAVLKGALRAARAHEVSIDSGFAALVVGVCVIVGFARALDPGTNLMDAATPSLLAYNLTGRAMGRLYS